jgi:tetraacyldisaccharide 4'-kinase
LDRLLAPLAAGFRLGVELRRVAYARGWLETRRLNQPVISIGNLTLGGSGKTPLVAWIARRLLRLGWTPGILTRGYGRASARPFVLLAPAAERRADAREIGDEPALLAKSLPQVPIVVGRDRYRAGLLAEERFHVDIHLLDDGFQHWALARDVDVVALDVTQELSDGELVPAGRLREPCAALARAHVVILTRTELADPGKLEACVRQIHPRAAVFHCRTSLRSLLDVRNGRVHPPAAWQGKPVYAFCGIGNPPAFFANLSQWGFSLVGQQPFRDHHVYRVTELLAMLNTAKQSSATALVTTEKDATNLPRQAQGELPILACVTEMEIDRAEVLEQALLARVEKVRAAE